MRATKRSVPLARRQLRAERGKLVLAVIGVALSVALVGLLLALRAGFAKQVSTFEDRSGAAVYVGGKGARNLVATASAVPAGLAPRIERAVPGAAAAPISASLEMLTMHGRKAATFVVGFEAGRLGEPWKLADGRRPARRGEIAVDRIWADRHELHVGDRVAIRGQQLRVVGITDQTSAWMTPLLFVTRAEANALAARGDVASYILVDAPRGVSDAALARRLQAKLPGFAVMTRAEITAHDRQLMTSPFDAPLLVMVAVALGVGALVIGLSVYGFVTERRREFGTLKALGGSARRLYGSVAAQALAIAGAGVVGGLLLQRVGAKLMGVVDARFLFEFKPGHVVVALVAAFVMALLGAWAPARVVARLDPAEVFRK